MDALALILAIVAAVAYIPSPKNPLRGWGPFFVVLAVIVELTSESRHTWAGF